MSKLPWGDYFDKIKLIGVFKKIVIECLYNFLLSVKCECSECDLGNPRPPLRKLDLIRIIPLYLKKSMYSVYKNHFTYIYFIF